MKNGNLAARAGRWSAAHWKTATLAWIAFVVVAIVAGRALGTVSLSDSEQTTGEAARAQAILQDAGFSQPAAETVLVQSTSKTISDPAFRATVDRVTAKLRTLPQVQDVRSPLDGGVGVVSKDRHSAIVQFSIRGKAVDADSKIQPVLGAVDAIQARSPGFTVAEFGFASANKELNDTVGKDFANAEKLSVPITFIILLFAFGAFVAAGVPVLLAFTAVLASIGLSGLVSHLSHASDATNSVILLMGMAVGVDYSLFYLKREREERLAGHGEDALPRAAATSGQAVLISGGTVLIAMAGMLLAGTKIFTSIGIGAMLVVFVSMVGSLSVLPALLAKLDDRIERGIVAVGAAGIIGVLRRRPAVLVRLRDRKTFLRRLKGDRPESRLWAAALKPVLRFPAISAAIAVAFLVLLALPARGIHTKLLSFTDLPRDIPIVKTYVQIQKAFPGAQSPAQVVVEAPDVTTPQVQHAIAAMKTKALATGVMFEPIQQFVNPAKTVVRIEVPLAGNGDDKPAVAALQTLRSDVLPATLGRVAGASYAVTGETAGTHDFNETMKQRFPIVFGFVLLLAFVLLLITFRSVVVPATAIALNLLSVGAAYGVLVWIFQDGHLHGLLNFQSNGGVVTWLPLFLFTVLFGLSMDYHVFIVSRIKELVDQGESTEDAVAHGIRRTASTVTSAAAVMVAVFGIFASLRTLDIKQLGVGLAVAVLLDATVIRGILLPATMKLLGEWNWYLPRWLEWLPRLTPEYEEEEEPVEARPLPAA